MDDFLQANLAQLPGLILYPKNHISVMGRGTGKSADMAFTMRRLVISMPRGVFSITGQDYVQLFNRTLPSTLKMLDKMGFTKGVNYVVGIKPPKHFIDSYEILNNFSNVISFSNGSRFVLISQSGGSGRGANIDYEMVDEALTVDKEKYDYDIKPTNRGNLEFFGIKSNRPTHLHHGFKYSTSMPVTKKGRWVLDYADYYYKEAGIPLFDIWNRIVEMQVAMLDIPEDNKVAFMQQYNEMARIKRKIAPFVSKDNILFTIGNAFDNFGFAGIKYIRDQQKGLPKLIFMTEIMNYHFDKVEDCFYAINEAKQIYYTGGNNNAAMDYAQSVEFNPYKLEVQSSRFDSDCAADLPLEIVADWGGHISLFCVCQTRNYDFVTGTVSNQPCHNFINEFFVKPDGSTNVLINELCDKFSSYYANHQNRELHYYKDRHGNSATPNTAGTYNEMAIANLKKAGWKVREFQHPGQEPPQYDKYLLWGVLLREDDQSKPKIRFNGNNCRYTLFSMNNSRFKNDSRGNLSKDKSSERPTSGVPPEEATHFSDAADKIIWTKYRKGIARSEPEHIPIYLGSSKRNLRH